MSNNKINSAFDEFVEDLLQERSPRPLIIIASSKIDSLLCQILSVYLLPKTAKSSDPDELLEGDRPLSTFSARIKLCYRLGLIDVTLFRALEQLRALRNSCAHYASFDSTRSPSRERISDLRKNLSTRQSFQLTKNTYFDQADFSKTEELQCLLLTLCVLLQAICSKTSTTRGRKATLLIAGR